MEENGADHDVAMEGSDDLFIGNCNSTGESETNDRVFQVRYECLVLVHAFFTSSLINLQYDSSLRCFFLPL